MIYWENTKNPKLKGKARGKEHFNSLNKLANGYLKQVEGVSDEASKIANTAASDAENSAKDAENNE